MYTANKRRIASPGYYSHTKTRMYKRNETRESLTAQPPSPHTLPCPLYRLSVCASLCACARPSLSPSLVLVFLPPTNSQCFTGPAASRQRRRGPVIVIVVVNRNTQNGSANAKILDPFHPHNTKPHAPKNKRKTTKNAPTSTTPASCWGGIADSTRPPSACNARTKRWKRASRAMAPVASVPCAVAACASRPTAMACMGVWGGWGVWEGWGKGVSGMRIHVIIVHPAHSLFPPRYIIQRTHPKHPTHGSPTHRVVRVQLRQVLLPQHRQQPRVVHPCSVVGGRWGYRKKCGGNPTWL